MNDVPKIFARSAEDAFHKILSNIEEHGVISSPRGMKVKELLNVNITIENPRDRIVSCPERHFSAPYAFGELSWYFSARNDLDMMKYYSKMMERGTDDGKTLNSAYGYRIFGKHKMIPFNQWNFVVDTLRNDRDSRRAVIHLHTPNNEKTNDEVCTMSLQFLIRDGKLDMITTMRSNDVVLGFTYDVFAFTVIQELMANEIGVELGKYHHNVGSMHIYENKFYLFKRTESELGEMSKVGMTDISYMISKENEIREFVCKNKEKEDSMLHFFNTKLEEMESILMRPKSERKIGEFGLMSFAAFMMKSFEFVNKDECVKFQNALLNMLHSRGMEYESDVLMGKSKFSKGGRKVIVEGVDKVGKSTMVGNLARTMDFKNARLSHFDKPGENYRFYANYWQHISSDYDEIMDRSFISELVYGKVFRGNARLSFDEIVRLADKMIKTKTIVFVIIPQNEEEKVELLSRLKGSDDEDIVDKLDEIIKEYEAVSDTLRSCGVDVEIIRMFR